MHIRTPLETKEAPDGGATLDDISAAIEQHAEATEKKIAEQAGIIAKQAEKIDGLNNVVVDLEQKAAERQLGNVGGTGRSLGFALAAKLGQSPAFQAVAKKESQRTSVEVKASDLLETKNTITYDSDFFNVSERQPEIVTGPKRRTWLRERFRSVPVNGGEVEYHRLLTFTNASAPQGGGSPHVFEGVTKPESTMTFEAKTEKIQTIAAWIKASKQILGDQAMLGMTLDTQLRFGLEQAIESQILTGSGVGSNMSGLTTNATAFSATSGDTALDSLSRAQAAISAAEGVADLVVLHPNDWASIQRLKASTAGTFLLGNPAAGNAPNVWGLPVHLTPAMTSGKFLIADTAQAAVIFNRSDAVIETGYVGDDFTKNLVTILAEVRLTIAVQQPTMLRFGSLTLA
ncbi:MAG: phage major capsid protein [Rhodospirillales bacterium]